ncbi:MAG TPA: hypothetical protein PK765_03380 [bacterium]|nr:hypothetical protein [bacterium]
MDNILSSVLIDALAASPSPVLLVLAIFQAYEISRLSKSLEQASANETERIFRLVDANQLQTDAIRDLATETAFVRMRIEELPDRINLL